MSQPQFSQIGTGLHTCVWGPFCVVIEKLDRRQNMRSFRVWPKGEDPAKARYFSSFGECEFWALSWLWRARGGDPAQLPPSA